MQISGVVILIDPEQSQAIFDELKKFEGVTTYGLHKERYIIAVFEAETPKELEKMSKRISGEVDGVLGVFPAYMNFEEEVEQA